MSSARRMMKEAATRGEGTPSSSTFPTTTTTTPHSTVALFHKNQGKGALIGTLGLQGKHLKASKTPQHSLEAPKRSTSVWHLLQVKAAVRKQP